MLIDTHSSRHHTTPEQMFLKWTARHEEMDTLGVLVNGAALCRDILSDLRELQLDMGVAVLTLREASELSGYSADHLGRLIRERKIPNAGRPGAPRIRIGDVPAKPGRRVASVSVGEYDAATDARSLVSRRKGGGNAPS